MLVKSMQRKMILNGKDLDQELVKTIESYQSDREKIEKPIFNMPISNNPVNIYNNDYSSQVDNVIE